MTINIDVHHYIHSAPGEPGILQPLKDIIMSNHAELTASIQAVSENVAKIGGETRTLLERIAALEAAIEAGDEVPQAVLDALSALQAQVLVVDGLVPDAAP